MSYLRTAEAARLLNVSPNTLRAWERRFSFPHPTRSEGGHRQYRRGEIAALRDALRSGLSISSAISHARADAVAGTPTSLLASLTAFDARRATRVLELTFAIRSLEQSVEEILLPALDQLVLENGVNSARWSFAAEWAMTWIRRGIAFAGPTSDFGSVVIANACRDELDPEGLRVRLLELLCRRGGLSVLCVSVRGTELLDDMLVAHPHDLVVIAGSRRDDDAAARWVHAARRSAHPVAHVFYGGGRPSIKPQTADPAVLPHSPLAASERVLTLLASTRSSHARRAS